MTRYSRTRLSGGSWAPPQRSPAGLWRRPLRRQPRTAPERDLLANVDPELRPAARKMLSGPRDRRSIAIISTSANPSGTTPGRRGRNPGGTARDRRAGRRAERPGLRHQRQTRGIAPGDPPHPWRRLCLRQCGQRRLPRARISQRISTASWSRSTTGFAPEARYRASIEENYAALKWLFDNAEALGVDRSRIAVMGEKRRRRPCRPACADRPRQGRGTSRPATADISDARRSHRQQPDAATAYRPDRVERGTTTASAGDRSSARHPGHADRAGRRGTGAGPDTPRGLPPTFIGVGSIDLFVEEDIALCRRLGRQRRRRLN